MTHRVIQKRTTWTAGTARQRISSVQMIGLVMGGVMTSALLQITNEMVEIAKRKKRNAPNGGLAMGFVTTSATMKQIRMMVETAMGRRNTNIGMKSTKNFRESGEETVIVIARVTMKKTDETTETARAMKKTGAQVKLTSWHTLWNAHLAVHTPTLRTLRVTTPVKMCNVFTT